ncbi:MAG: orotate phosphoribosyltransferase [Gammaproteobacteria bacterium]|nr:MAG: orotate phosphoribosyltransferase [Gammaproteobacteria bacterium]
MEQYQLTFIDLALKREALRFGRFTLKSGRESPYFFNAGLFSDGEALASLGKCYAAAIVHSGIRFDMIFGPAYKGIALAVATVMALSGEHGRSVPYAFNRKEAKDHGEGGTLVGAKLAGRVLIIDDVISAGTSVRESIAMISAAHATPCGVAIALDRQEKATENGADVDWSAVQYVSTQLKLQVVAIATLADLLQYLRSTQDASLAEHAPRVEAYRQRYGV